MSFQNPCEKHDPCCTLYVKGRLTNFLSRPCADSLGQLKLKGRARQCYKGRLTNFLSRLCADSLGQLKLEGRARQYAKGRLTNFLSRPCADSLGQLKLKAGPVSMPRVA